MSVWSSRVQLKTALTANRRRYMTDGFVIFAGSTNAGLAGAIALELGVSLGACSVERFPDG